MLYTVLRTEWLIYTRKFSFFIMTAATLLAGYLFVPAPDAPYVTLDLGGVRGIYNSAWTGGMVAILTVFFLSLAGFFYFRDVIEKDRHSTGRDGVGQLIATSPIRTFFYILYKFLSVFLLLTVFVVLLALSALVMQWVRAESVTLDWWALSGPFLLIAWPVMSLVAALTVLWSSVSWLRGSLGNVVYVCLWVTMLTLSVVAGDSLDPLGIRLLLDQMTAGAKVAVPSVEAYDALGQIGFIMSDRPLTTFEWTGVHWDARVVVGRLLLVALAFLVTVIAALLFNRFGHERTVVRRNEQGATTVTHKEKMSLAELGRTYLADSFGSKRLASGLTLGHASSDTVAAPTLDSLPNGVTTSISPLAPPTASTVYMSYGRLISAEFRLMAKELNKGALVIAAALFVASLFAPSAVTREWLLPLAWIVPLPIWAKLGIREKVYGTRDILFSSVSPLRYQFVAMWGAAVLFTLAFGGGAALKFVISGEWGNVLAWLVGGLFIPTLAVALGVWSGVSRWFEIAYLAWWYVGPLNQVPQLDFMGATGFHPTTQGIFLFGSMLLFLFALIGRKREIRSL